MIKGNKELIKHINSMSVLSIIRENIEISRADIAKKSGLNPATVSSNTKDLLDSKLIKEVGIGTSSGGRKPLLYRINDKDVYTVGVFLSPDYVSCALVNLLGEIYIHKQTHYKEGAEFNRVMDIVYELIEDLIGGARLEDNIVLGIGIGINGLVDYNLGKSIHAPVLNWTDKDIVGSIKERYKLPTFVDNDCRVMAIGEKWFGRAKKCNDFILLYLDKGIGAGIYIDKQILRGNNFTAGEIGHINILGKDNPCKCGKKGCLESLSSEYAIIESYKRLTKENKSLIEIIKLAEEGDEKANQVLTVAGEHIAYGISILSNILNPERIILAGSIIRSYDLIEKTIKKSLDRYGIYSDSENVNITTSNMGDEIGVIGAATLVIDNIHCNKIT